MEVRIFQEIPPSARAGQIHKLGCDLNHGHNWQKVSNALWL